MLPLDDSGTKGWGLRLETRGYNQGRVWNYAGAQCIPPWVFSQPRRRPSPLLSISLCWPVTLREFPCSFPWPVLSLILKTTTTTNSDNTKNTTARLGFASIPPESKGSTYWLKNIWKIGKISKTLKLQLAIISPSRDNPIYIVLYMCFFSLFKFGS